MENRWLINNSSRSQGVNLSGYFIWPTGFGYGRYCPSQTQTWAFTLLLPRDLPKRWSEDINPETEIVKLFEHFIRQEKNIKSLRPETLRGYFSVFETLLKLMPEITTVKEFNAANISEFFSRLQTRERIVGRDKRKIGVKKSTIFTYQKKLILFVKWLMIKGYLEENPFNQVLKAPQPIYDDSRSLSGKDIKAVFSALILRPAKSLLERKRNLVMLCLLLYAGLRKSEMRLLEVRDVDLDNRILTVRGEASKSKRTRQIPIHYTLLSHLKDYLIERTRKGYRTPFLIVSSLSDSGLSEGGLKHWTEKLEEISGLDFHLHQLRHTFAVSLARSNVNMAKIQKLLGHTDVKMTQKYLRSLGVEDLRDDVDSISIDDMI